MANKLWQSTSKRERLICLRIVADSAAERVSRSVPDWKSFPRFYSLHYKYTFPEALLLYEQAPHFTACGEIHHWNKIGRRVQRGTKGIPIVSDTYRDPGIRYVFDVADTYGENYTLPRKWTLKYEDEALAELQSRFTVPPVADDRTKNIKWAIEEYTRGSCGAFLGGLIGERSEQAIGTIVDSVGYLVCERLGLEKGIYDDREAAFQYLGYFASKEELARIGAATGQISKSVLGLIAETIQKQERIRQNERLQQLNGAGGVSATVGDGG